MAGKKQKRGNGEGSITQRGDGRWMARITLENGTRKCYYGKTRDEVKRKLTRGLHDQQEGLPVVAERQTVAQYFVWWLEALKRPRLRPRTYQRYEALIRLHIAPHIGGVTLARLTPQHLTSLYSQLLAAGQSRRSVEFAHILVHGGLKQAVRLQLIGRNPADAVDAPRGERKEMRALSADEARRLLDAARGDRLEAFYVLALTTGMRLGELLGLHWRDVDLDAGQLQVRTSLQRYGGQWLFAEPKTARSRRRITLPAVTVAALRAHRARQLAEIQQAGSAWVSYDLVFCGALGQPLHGTNLGWMRFHPLLKRAGLPRMRLHDLRHSTATILLAGNVHPKVVQELLGHSAITLTLDIYSHVLSNMQEQVAAHMDNVLGAPLEGAMPRP
jgi:integrase